MVKLRIRLTGKAEECFQDVLDKTGVSEDDVVGDAIALLHRAVMEVAGGKKIAIFNPETKEATPISLFTLDSLKTH